MFNPLASSGTDKNRDISEQNKSNKNSVHFDNIFDAMTQLMGILNVTPDSFFDGGRYVENAIERALEIEREGADIIDIGGESSRPGASPVSEDEELQRVIPIIEHLQDKISIPISIDTRKAGVASAAVEAGATLINDITGFSDPAMCEVAASTGANICVMHMQGTPQIMQKNPHYPEGVVPHVLNWFEKRLESLFKTGIHEKKIILDPGIGFGKTISHNLEIIHNLQKFKTLGFPILLGVSRKSFMSKIVNKPAKKLLPTTVAMNTIAILSEVDIIRVHDVKEHRDVIDVLHSSAAKY